MANRGGGDRIQYSHQLNGFLALHTHCIERKISNGDGRGVVTRGYPFII
jgi:hypothetical protein